MSAQENGNDASAIVEDRVITQKGHTHYILTHSKELEVIKSKNSVQIQHVSKTGTGSSDWVVRGTRENVRQAKQELLNLNALDAAKSQSNNQLPLQVRDDEDELLPEGWQRKTNSAGRTYYFNPLTGDSLNDKPTQAAVKPKDNDVSEVQCMHLLVKHAGSRNPASWRSDKITRSKDDAKTILNGYAKEINEQSCLAEKRAKFKALAKAFSDCSSAGKGGDLGFINRNMFCDAFTQTSFTLDVDHMSDIVETESGLHLIWRLA